MAVTEDLINLGFTAGVPVQNEARILATGEHKVMIGALDADGAIRTMEISQRDGPMLNDLLASWKRHGPGAILPYRADEAAKRGVARPVFIGQKKMGEPAKLHEEPKVKTTVRKK
jgi:hypothetical protein